MKKTSSYFIASLGVLGVVLIVTAIFLIDSPNVMKLKKADERIVKNIQNIHSASTRFYEETGEVPQNIHVLEQSELGYIDMMGVEYSMIDSFEPKDGSLLLICATFNLSVKDTKKSPYMNSIAWNHGKGRQCFNLQLDKKKLNVADLEQ